MMSAPCTRNRGLDSGSAGAGAAASPAAAAAAASMPPDRPRLLVRAPPSASERPPSWLCRRAGDQRPGVSKSGMSWSCRSPRTAATDAPGVAASLACTSGGPARGAGACIELFAAWGRLGGLLRRWSEAWAGPAGGRAGGRWRLRAARGVAHRGARPGWERAQSASARPPGCRGGAAAAPELPNNFCGLWVAWQQGPAGEGEARWHCSGWGCHSVRRLVLRCGFAASMARAAPWARRWLVAPAAPRSAAVSHKAPPSAALQCRAAQARARQLHPLMHSPGGAAGRRTARSPSPLLSPPTRGRPSHRFSQHHHVRAAMLQGGDQ